MPDSFSSQEDSFDRVRRVRAAMPPQGMFEQKEWRVSPQALELSAAQVEQLETMGSRLLVFQKACNLLYRQSVSGKAPAWVAEWLDLGKPPELVAWARDASQKNRIPDVIRPDLVLTETGWALAEIDSVPGGVGLTAWLNETYADLGEPVLGGRGGMRAAVHRLLPDHHVVIADEALSYRPEWEWLLGADRVKRAEDYQWNGHPVYRFFEAFDWPNLPGLRESGHPESPMTPPLKPYLEEKMWLALFWLKPLQDFWRRELGERYWKDLQQIIPESWLVHPEPLPPTAVLPGLNANSWAEVGKFTRKERDLILKVSGFSELAWGSRGVVVASDVSNAEWQQALAEAVQAFPRQPRMLQRFVKGRVLQHPYWDENTGELRVMKGRARICPYYFVEDDKAVLKGVLATICPEDKKLLHGMKDAILVPVKAAA